jgi:hypothetical protein
MLALLLELLFVVGGVAVIALVSMHLPRGFRALGLLPLLGWLLLWAGTTNY